MVQAAELDRLMAAAMALALGLLVGLQRGWAARDRAGGTRFAGVRTFALLGLAGGIAGLVLAEARGVATAMLVAASALVLIGYARVSAREGRVSGTSGIVALLTLAAGFLAGTGERLLATAIAAIMVLLLAMREQLHRWVRHLSEREVMSIARFAVIALVILPLLPDRAFGPYLAWNPRKLWLVVVLVSGFSFAGYFAARLLGETRGIIATAAAGSVVSSTAVTASLATRMKQGAGDTDVLAAGISAASVVMYLRIMVLTAAIAPFALASLARLVVPGMLVSAAFAAWSLRAAGAAGENGASVRAPAQVRNPFDLGPALGLTALVMALSVTARFVLDRFGEGELVLVLAISGMVDVDSTIITMGGLPAGTLHHVGAALLLALSVGLNTLFKAGVAVSIGGWPKARHGALPLVASAAAVAGAAALMLI